MLCYVTGMYIQPFRLQDLPFLLCRHHAPCDFSLHTESIGYRNSIYIYCIQMPSDIYCAVIFVQQNFRLFFYCFIRTICTRLRSLVVHSLPRIYRMPPLNWRGCDCMFATLTVPQQFSLGYCLQARIYLFYFISWWLFPNHYSRNIPTVQLHNFFCCYFFEICYVCKAYLWAILIFFLFLFFLFSNKNYNFF